jgi:ElaB/YqjD/DUF883 family membrane-anchored ribosome-binding protein
MMTRMTAVKEAIKDRMTPALEELEENAQEARRTIVHGRHAVGDLVASTALRVRWRPLAAMALAASMGALAGCLIGFALGRRSHGRTTRWSRQDFNQE